MKEQSSNFFDSFVNKYEISKTLRFELKPVGKTIDLLKENKVFEKDKTIDDSYNQAKFYFDEMHREFIKKSLSDDVSFDIVRPLIEILEERNGSDNTSNKKDFDKKWEVQRKFFCKNVSVIFAKNDSKIKNKYLNAKEDEIDEGKGVKFILSAKVINYLKDKFPSEKDQDYVGDGKPSLFVTDLVGGNKKYIFDSFDKFSTYLSKFQETRKNLYSSDDKATSIASRIIDNLVVFIDNKNKFDKKLKGLINEIQVTNLKYSIFKQEFYLKCFIQDGIDIYNKSIGELNKVIKELRDKEESVAKIDGTDFKKSDYPLLIELDKQILSYVEKEEEFIKDDSDLREKFNEFIKNNDNSFKKAKLLVGDFCGGKFLYEYNKIYFQKKNINSISRNWFLDSNGFELLLPQSSSKKEDKNIANIKKNISANDIKLALENTKGLSGDVFRDKYYNNSDLGLMRDVDNVERFNQFLKIFQFEFNNLFIDRIQSNKEIIKGYNSSLTDLKSINWNNLFKKDKSLDTYKKEVEKIKVYSDVCLSIFQMMKYFSINNKDALSVSDIFYGELQNYNKDYNFIHYYNSIRNYITKKSFSTDKIKLNFENGQLMSGFDKNKEQEKFGIILKKDDLYYLAILVGKYKNIFEDYKNNSNEDCYEKMVYKLFPDPKRMIPKISFAKKNKAIFGLTEDIENIKKEYKKFQDDKKDKDNWNNKFDKIKCTKLIKYYQNCLEIGGYKKEFGFIWKKPEDYLGVGDFNNDIERQNYKVTFDKINTEYINTNINNGKMYLFQIYSKDFSDKSKNGHKNIHTLYLLNLFSSFNLKNPILKLSGGAEIFFRGKTDELPLYKKNGKCLTYIDKKDNKKKEVIQHRRFSDDKILFHFPIKINSGESAVFNKQMNRSLIENRGINIIGIDRGEKNLLYYSVINQKGEILEQDSLNVINNINYYEKLNQREKERFEAIQSWNQIEQIKDLKKGYLSLVVHKICRLIEKYNAIVVLEDLNMRFKQIRGGIEKSVYQQFEKALIDKLGYLVFKDRNPEDLGGALNGYQLTAPFESFEKMYKQTGILFYTQADYTSVTDPLTGFRKNIYIGNSWSVGKIEEILNKFKSIVWDNEIGAYAFTYNQSDFVSDIVKIKNKSKNSEIRPKEWTVFSHIPRIERFRNDDGYWNYRVIDINSKIEELLNIWKFENTKGDIWEQIQQMEADKSLSGERIFDGKKRTFYHSFIYLFNLILQLRNSFSKKTYKDNDGNLKEVGDDIDFIASPVRPFFKMGAVSKKNGVISELNLGEFNNKIISFEKDKIIKNLNADANGAYNIARKGIIILDKIKQNPDKPELFISKDEWDKFTQK